MTHNELLPRVESPGRFGRVPRAMTATAPSAPPPVSMQDEWARLAGWLRREPLGAVLLMASAAALVYFFGFYRVFMNGTESTAEWAWKGWNEENDQEHCRFIVPILLFLFWHQREELLAAVKRPSGRGLAIVVGG